MGFRSYAHWDFERPARARTDARILLALARASSSFSKLERHGITPAGLCIVTLDITVFVFQSVRIAAILTIDYKNQYLCITFSQETQSIINYSVLSIHQCN